MKVFVTGGSGVVGRAAVENLLAAGHEVRLFCRGAEHAGRQWAGPVEVCAGSVTAPTDIHGAAEGCEAVLHLAGIAAEDPPEATYERVNVEGTRRVLAEAERAGADRFVYVSSLGADRGHTAYHRSKREAEALVRDFGGSWLIVRPGNVYGPGDKMISELLKMVRTFPVIPTVEAGEEEFQPIFAPDLGQALARAVEAGDPRHTTVEVAGPDRLTANHLLELLAEVTGKKLHTVPVPEWVALLGSAAANRVGFDLHFSRDQIQMLMEGSVIRSERGNALQTEFGVEPTGMRDGLTQLIAALPEQLPEEGVGKLRQERHWADIHGSALDADALFRMICDDFYDIPPEGLLKVGVEPLSGDGLREGAVLAMSIPLRGHVQVRVEEIRDRAATVMTLQGHPLTGLIRFAVEEPRPDEDDPAEGELRFEIRSFTRAATVVDYAALAAGGHLLREQTWNAFVREVVRRSGGHAPDGVESEARKLNEEEADRIQGRAEDLALRRRREEERERRSKQSATKGCEISDPAEGAAPPGGSGARPA